MLLVLVAAGAPTIAATGNGPIDRGALAIAPGLTVTALIYALGTVSGAHFNPVVTLTFAVRGDFPWRRVPRYAAPQLAGAVVSCLFLRAMFGVVGHLGATLPGPHATDLQAVDDRLLGEFPPSTQPASNAAKDRSPRPARPTRGGC